MIFTARLYVNSQKKKTVVFYLNVKINFPTHVFLKKKPNILLHCIYSNILVINYLFYLLVSIPCLHNSTKITWSSVQGMIDFLISNRPTM